MPIRLLLQLEATAVSIIYYLAWRSSLASTTQEYCRRDPETAEEYCATYDVTTIFVLKIGRFIEHHDGAIVALFTIILGIGTIWLAVATRKLAIGAETNAERQLRAYINLEEAHVVDFDKPRIFARARVVNFGQTPAYQVTFRMRVLIMSGRPIVGADNFEDIPRRTAGVIGPQHKFDCVAPMSPLPQTLKDDILADRVAIFLLGRIDYVDAFGCPRWTIFAETFSGRDAANGPRCAVWEEGNESN